ncbi:MAG: hypothetical protein ACM3XZ_05140 [Betaproteobacteria bacterium]
MANKLNVVVGANLDEFAKAMKQLARDVNTLERQFSGFDRIGDRLSNFGRTLMLGVTAPIVAAGAAAAKFAMDAVESENLFEVSMGNMADAARQWSEELSDALGLNEYELRRNIGTFNVMFHSMGLGEQAAFDMAKGLTQLAYDMASFYNLRPEEAFEKLRAGISGEIEPLKQLGIVVNETTVKTYAYTHGIAKQGEELTEQQKVLARYGVIMEATQKAQGDLARTIQSPTNQLRIMSSSLQEVAVNLGNVLLPAVTTLITKLADFAKWLGTLDPATIQWGVAIAGVAAAVGPLLFGLGRLMASVPQMVAGLKMIQNATTILKGAFVALAGNPIAVVVAGIAGVAALAFVVYKNWDKISTWFANMWAAMSYNVQKAWLTIEGAIARAVAAIFDKLAPVAKWLPDALGGKAFENAHRAVDAFADRTKQALENLKPPVMKHVENTVKLEKATVDVSDALKYQTKVTDENALANENAAKSKKTVADVLEELKQKLAAATENEAALGDKYDEAAEKARLVESAITQLTEMGLKASDPVIQQLVKDWQGYNAEVERANKLAEEAKKAKTIAETLSNLGAELQKAANMGEVFGGSFDITEAQIQATEQALKRLIELGLDPTSADVVYLQDRLNELKDSQAAQAEAAEDAAKREAGASAIAKQAEIDRWTEIQKKINEAAKDEEAAAERAKAAELARGKALQQLVNRQIAVNNVVEQAEKDLEAAATAASVFGTENRLAQQKVDILKKAVQDLINMGLKPGDPVLDSMAQKLKAAQAEMSNTATRAQSLSDVLSNAFLTMAGSADNLAKNMVSFFDSIGSGQKDFKTAMKDALIAIVSGLEQMVIANQLAAAGWAAANSLWTFGAAWAAFLAALPTITAALAGFELVKAGIRALAEGGIVTAPTLALIGEGQGPEAVVPLDRMGEFAGAFGGEQTIIINLDGRTIARSTVQHMPSVLRLQGVPI